MKKLMSWEQIETELSTIRNEIEFLSELCEPGGEYTSQVPTADLVNDIYLLMMKRQNKRDALSKARDSYLKTIQIPIWYIEDTPGGAPIVQTVAAWAKQKGYEILDNDGFPKGLDALVSEDEFDEGIGRCTVHYVVAQPAKQQARKAYKNQLGTFGGAGTFGTHEG